ncbi:hypothetical protein QQS21_005669 [Conoideocrella luteorostrata]|uniref:Uncharacterized protein n=1 Tax=Conoideocrella luteorostrata TaxID=1105319 RepID=A0AAJ0FYX7_9HYPO|nr:hypothetical protein QQS21_005669 [Conoideocrella luteorostrata]
MVQVAAFTIFALVTLAKLGLAGKCWKDYHYCGRNLLEKDADHYAGKMSAALEAMGMAIEDGPVDDTLFFCTGEDDAELLWQHNCAKCVDNKRNSDYCGPLPEVPEDS